MNKKIKFYFDFLSPYSYFGWQSHKNQPLSEYEFEYIPVAMGQLFNHFEIKGPALVKPKREYLLKFCFRYAKKSNIYFAPPKEHPFNPLYALRLATKECAGENQRKIIDLLFSWAWSSKQINLSNPDEIEAALNQAGLNGSKLLEKASSREVKQALKNNVAAAIENEVFGVPTFITENELFWGNDSIPDLLNFLEGKDLLDREKFNQAINSNPLL